MAAHQALPSLGFSRQEHWSGLSLPSPMHESESEVAQSCPTLATPWTAAYQAPPSMGLSRQEYWSGVPLPSPLLCYHITKKNTWVVNNSDLLPVPKSLIKQLIWCTILDAWGWCTGMTQRDDTGREVGGRFTMGNTCTPEADSCWYMAKPIKYCKVKKEKKRKKIKQR